MWCGAMHAWGCILIGGMVLAAVFWCLATDAILPCLLELCLPQGLAVCTQALLLPISLIAALAILP